MIHGIGLALRLCDEDVARELEPDVDVDEDRDDELEEYEDYEHHDRA